MASRQRDGIALASRRGWRELVHDDAANALPAAIDQRPRRLMRRIGYVACRQRLSRGGIHALCLSSVDPTSRAPRVSSAQDLRLSAPPEVRLVPGPGTAAAHVLAAILMPWHSWACIQLQVRGESWQGVSLSRLK
jgi:hypothetical protein